MLYFLKSKHKKSYKLIITQFNFLARGRGGEDPLHFLNKWRLSISYIYFKTIVIDNLHLFRKWRGSLPGKRDQGFRTRFNFLLFPFQPKLNNLLKYEPGIFCIWLVIYMLLWALSLLFFSFFCIILLNSSSSIPFLFLFFLETSRKIFKLSLRNFFFLHIFHTQLLHSYSR